MSDPNGAGCIGKQVVSKLADTLHTDPSEFHSQHAQNDNTIDNIAKQARPYQVRNSVS